MRIYIKKIIYLFLIISTTLFSSQKQTDNIANISANSLYNVNKTALQNTIKAYIDSNHNIKALKIVESLAEETYISIYRDEKGNLIEGKFPDNIKQLQSYKSISNHENEVVGEIFAYYEKTTKVVNLTTKEISWMKSNPAINIAVVENYPPFDFRDKQNKLIGFNSDLIKTINENLGINIVLKPFYSWKEAYGLAIEGGIHGILSLSWSKEREDKYFIYSSPYHFTPYNLVVKKIENRINSLINLSDKTISVEIDTIYKNLIEEKVPSAKMIFVTDAEEAYASVSNGEANATISQNKNPGLLNKYGLKISSEIYHKSSNLYIGTNKKYPIIAAILRKGIDSLSLKQQSSLRKKWFTKAKSKKNLTLAVGFNKEPFMFGKTSKKGIELDLAKKALEFGGYKVKQLYKMGSDKAANILNTNKNIDVAVTVRKIKGSGLFYSDKFINFDNVAITRKSDNIKIDSEDDLLDKKVVAWGGAYKDLTPKYEELFSPKNTKSSSKYSEIVDQVEQHRRFFAKEVDVIVVDKTIFEWQKHNFKNKFELSTEYEAHNIFPEKTYFYVAFRDEKIRDSFNEGLKKIKNEGFIEKTYQYYIEGNIGLQLDIGNLVSRIASRYIFEDDIEGLKKVLNPFLKIDILHDIDIYSSSTNELVLHIEKGNNTPKEFVTIEKESYYRGSGNPLKVGHIKILFDYEKVKTHTGSAIPELSTFKFLDSNEYSRIDSIYKKYKQDTSSLDLTEDEKTWIKSHPIIKFTGDPAWLPFEAFNNEGKYIGIASEYLDKLEDLTGIKFKKIPVASWNNSLELSKSRKVDVLSETTDASREGLLFTKPYLTNEIVIVMDKDHNYVDGIDFIKSQTIALIKDYGYAKKIEEKFPNINFVNVANVESGLSAVSTGKVDAFLCTFALGSYTTTTMGLSNIKIVGKTQFSTSLGLGIREDYAPLVSILNKAIDNISFEEHNEIFNHWIKQDYVEKVDYSLLYKVGAGAFILILMFVFWNRKMANEISKRKEIENRLNDSSSRLITLFDASPDSVAIIDGEGNYIDCNEASLQIFGVVTKEDFLKLKPSDLSPVIQRDTTLSSRLVAEAIGIALEKGTNRFEWIHKRIDTQEPFYAEVILKSIILNSKPHIYAVVRDINKQKKAQSEIKQLHKNTTDSIEYASLIQGALIPNNHIISNYFNDYLTIWQPKDIVGGDIYLFEELRNQNECLLMVIDCTGHGVPGAFVTMLVKAIERQIISKIENDKSIDVSPAWILSYFNKTMKKLLQQESDDSVSNAGFDGGIIYYNKKDKILKFAGAETPLFYIENNELKTIKGNRHSIGYKKSDIEYEFIDHVINVKNGMKFYLSTDGYFDQNGGEKSFPFGKKRFTDLIQENYKKPLSKQKDLFIDSLKSYQEHEDRNDDITIFAFEIQDKIEDRKEIIIEYSGILTQGIISHTMEIIEKEISNMGMMGKVSTTVIELLQNMVHYGKGEGSYRLIKDNNDYEIRTKNVIFLEDKNKIEEKLLEIKSLDETGIKKRYRELRRSGENTHEKGGGIGLYEVAKLVKNIEFTFVKIDENSYTYEFVSQIVSKKKEIV